MSSSNDSETGAIANVLFFVGGFGIGGTERHLSQLLPELKDLGYVVSVCCLGPDGAFSTIIREAGINVRTIERSQFLIRVPVVRGLLSLAFLIVHARAEIRCQQPDLVHCFLPTPCIIGWLACIRMRAKVKLVLSRRSQRRWTTLFPGDKYLEAKALKSADRVFAHSSVVAREIEEDGVRPKSIRVIHNGIASLQGRATEERSTACSPLGCRRDEVLIVCVANLIPYKGHLELLAAAKSLMHTAVGWRLLLVGQGNQEFTSNINNVIDENGLSKCVEMLGVRDDIHEWIASCDIGVLASHHEGFSNAILEYMSASLPVVATDVGGNRDAVVDGETGFLVQPGDIDSLASKLKLLVENAELRRILGQCGLRRSQQEFSIVSMIRKYHLEYSDVLQTR